MLIVDEKHADRAKNPKLIKPMEPYLTEKGGGPKSFCHGHSKLSDFSVDQLGTQVELFWHNRGHGVVGSPNHDMARTGEALKDLVFFMWHKTLDKLYDKRLSLNTP